MQRLFVTVVGFCFCWASSIETTFAQDKPIAVKLEEAFTGHPRDVGNVDSMHYSPSGKYLLTSGFFGTVLWDLETGKILKKHPTGNVALFSRDEKHIFIGSRLKPLTRVDLAKWESVEWEHAGTVECMALSPDGDHLLCGGATKKNAECPGVLSLWSLKEGKRVRTMEGHQLPVRAVAFVPNKFQAISFSPDYTNRLWDLAEGKELHRLGTTRDEGDDFRPIPLAIFRDSGFFTNGYSLRQIDGFATKHKLDLTESQRGERPRCVAVSPDQRLVVVGNEVGRVRLWDAKTQKILDTFHANNAMSTITAIAFSPDGKFFATAVTSFNPSFRGTEYADLRIKIWKVPPVD